MPIQETISTKQQEEVLRGVSVKHAGGFTLIETAVTIGLFAGIMTLVSMFSLDVTDIALKLDQDLDAQLEVQLAVSGFMTELRAIAPSDNGSYPLATADSSSISFYTDLESDGRHERVRYFFTSSTLMKGITRPTGTPAVYATSSETISDIAHNVLSGEFTYYGANFTGIEAPLVSPVTLADVRVVRFSITVDRFPGATPGPLSATIFITLRNLRAGA